jgi:DNA invertase Pin-like site-specific DNA recombinase
MLVVWRLDRPGLRDALDALCPDSTLVVWRLDRLGRSLGNLATIINDRDAQKVRFVSLTEHIDTRSSSGRFTFHVLAALAEFERGLISERTRAGMVGARERGSRIGRPKLLSAEQHEQARALLKQHSAVVVAQEFNVHQRTLRRYMSKAT